MGGSSGLTNGTNAIGRTDNKRYGCANHRNRGTCANATRVSREKIEQRILTGLKDRLLSPDLLEAFAKEYYAQLNKTLHEAEQVHQAVKRDLARIDAKINAVLDAIENGLLSPALRERLSALEARKAELEAIPPRQEPAIRFHPRLAEIYSNKVAKLEEALNMPDVRDEAAQILRSLIDKAVLTPGKQPGEINARLYGEMANILNFSKSKKCTPHSGGVQLSMVAEERYPLYRTLRSWRKHKRNDQI